MKAFHVRAATPADAQRLQRVAEDTFEEAFGEALPRTVLEEIFELRFTVERFRGELRDPAFATVVAEDAEGFQGYGVVQSDAPPVPLEGAALELGRLYVRAARHGEGVGEALMAACVAEARQRGARWLWLKVWEANVAAHEYGISLLKPGASCAEVTAKINDFFEERQLLQYRTFGYGHSFGVLSHYYGREAGLELREDIETVLAPDMVVSMEPMIMLPEGQPGAGGYREHDILVITPDGNRNLTAFPYGPAHNIIPA